MRLIQIHENRGQSETIWCTSFLRYNARRTTARKFETAGLTEIDIFISLLYYVVMYIATRVRGFNQLGQIISWVLSETRGSSLIPASPAISDAQEFSDCVTESQTVKPWILSTKKAFFEQSKRYYISH